MNIGKLLFRSFAESLFSVFCLYGSCMVFFPIAAYDPNINTLEQVLGYGRFVFFAGCYAILGAYLYQTYKIRMMHGEHKIVCWWALFFLGVPFIQNLFFWEIPLLVTLVVLISNISLAGYQHRATKMKIGQVGV